MLKTTMEKVYQRPESDWSSEESSTTPKELSSKQFIIDKEIRLDEHKKYLSSTDINGVITYCNKEFSEISGYQEWELVGASHNILRHPDIPKVIYRLIWNRLKTDNEIVAIIKNSTKSGAYYWSVNSFVIKKDEDGHTIGYKSYRKPISNKALDIIIPMYENLILVEKTKGILAAEERLIGYLEAKDIMYDTFIEELSLLSDTISEPKNSQSSEKKKSLFHFLF